MNKSTLNCLLLLALLSAQTFSLSYNKEEHLISHNSNPNTREEHIYMAKTAEKVERYEDMVDNMKKVVASDANLNVQERNLLFSAYQKTIDPRRAAWRNLASIQKKEQQKGSKNIRLLRSYKALIQAQLNKYCRQIINLIDTQLIPKAPSQSEAQIFYLKQMGDYYKYISEFTSGDERNKNSKEAQKAYQVATNLAVRYLRSTSPTRLDLALSYSVFNYQIKQDRSKAIQLAKKAIDDAMAKMDQADEEEYRETMEIFQRLKENQNRWTIEQEQAQN